MALYIAWQDYVETLEKLPKAKIFDLFQKRYLHSVTVKNLSPTLLVLALACFEFVLKFIRFVARLELD